MNDVYISLLRIESGFLCQECVVGVRGREYVALRCQKVIEIFWQDQVKDKWSLEKKVYQKMKVARKNFSWLQSIDWRKSGLWNARSP